jgi:hypothetical protein
LITYNSITIEDANPDSELMILRKTSINLIIPKLWVWEASHNTKEFLT